jgi:peptidoglycan-associated lipoprotein
MKLLNINIFIIFSLFFLSSCSNSFKNKFFSSSDFNFNYSNSNSIIYFDFDSYIVKSPSKNFLLNNIINSLKKNKKINLEIEGHTDERGTRFYNYNLGIKRANAIKNYLLKNNIESSRVKIYSYGELRPVDKSSNENAWKQNRRAVLIFK